MALLMALGSIDWLEARHGLSREATYFAQARERALR